MSDERGKVGMFEVFWKNLGTKEFLVFDDKGRAAFRPGQDMWILRVLEDIPCFLDKAWHAIFSHSSIEF